MKLYNLSRLTTKTRMKTIQQAQVSGKRIGLLDAHLSTGGHNDMVMDEGHIAGPGQ